MDKNEILSGLSDVQAQAASHIEGPSLIIAGAGSGKTRVLTHRIAYMLAVGIKPYNIMALTFTNKAAGEMKERIAKTAGADNVRGLWMGTFHSLFSRILRTEAETLGFTQAFTIYDTSDSRNLVKTIVKELNLNEDIYKPKDVASRISSLKNDLITPQAYISNAVYSAPDTETQRTRMGDIYREYMMRCKRNNAMDFDDLLLYTNLLFRDHKDVLRKYQDKFRYILVDEYQDTNFSQYLIIKELSAGSRNICVVGDDAQSIYSFRGAKIENILRFTKDYEGAALFKLEQNYRSTRTIVGAANSVISRNDRQIRKESFSRNEEGDPIKLISADTDKQEAFSVVEDIRSQAAIHKLQPCDIAVLYRTNSQSRVLEDAMRSAGIRYKIYGGLSFYQRAEIKDILAYVRLIVNPDDDEAFRRVINTPKRGIGDTTLGKIGAAAMSSGTSLYRVICSPDEYGLDVNKGTLAKISGFANIIRGFVESVENGAPAAVVARSVYEATGILKEYTSDNTPENISKRDNLRELLKAVDDFTDSSRKSGDDRGGMSDFLAEVSLLTDQDTPGEDADCMTLTTIHSAKGLEFDCVFVVGVEENLLPSQMCRSNADIEEERRLMYVAITRARKFCMISYARQRTVNGQSGSVIPSRFISDIDRRFLRMMTGTSPDTPRQRPVRPWDEPGQRPAERKPKAVESRTAPATPATPPPSQPRTSASDEFGLHIADDLKEGMRIQHPRFSTGTVVRVDTESSDHRVVVDFDNDGQRRTLLLKFAKFQILT